MSFQKYDLNQHISSIHEGKKPLKCEICKYKCAKKESLKQHISTVHEGCDLNQYISSIHEGKSHSNAKFVSINVLKKKV